MLRCRLAMVSASSAAVDILGAYMQAQIGSEEEQRHAQHFRKPEVVMTETASMRGLENPVNPTRRAASTVVRVLFSGFSRFPASAGGISTPFKGEGYGANVVPSSPVTARMHVSVRRKMRMSPKGGEAYARNVMMALPSNYGFSRGDPCGPAFRPIEPFAVGTRHVRSTSILLKNPLFWRQHLDLWRCQRGRFLALRLMWRRWASGAE